jgi:hypothetical protein
MKLRPGCGCTLLVVALVDLIGFLFWIAAAAVGGGKEEVTGTGIAMSVLMGLVLLANGIVCVAVGWGAVRAGGLKLPSMLEGEEED